MSVEKYFDKIEEYISGNLSESEVKAFEQELQENKELKSAFDSFQMSFDALDVLVEDQLRQELEHLKKSEALEAEGKIRTLGSRRAGFRRLYTTLAAAASVLLLIGFFSLQWANNTYSNDRLQTAFYQAPDWSNQRGNSVTDGSFQNGLEALENTQYDQAISIFEAIDPNADRYTDAQYYLGHAYYLTAKYEDAQKAFRNVVASNAPKFREKAEWYIILSQLNQKELNPDFFQQLDNLVADEGHSFQKEAQQLKNKLNSFWYRLVN